jgi:aspartate 1-decarboxylase
MSLRICSLLKEDDDVYVTSHENEQASNAEQTKPRGILMKKPNAMHKTQRRQRD